MVNWKGFRKKDCSLRKYAEIWLEKPEKKRNTTVKDSTEISNQTCPEFKCTPTSPTNPSGPCS